MASITLYVTPETKRRIAFIKATGYGRNPSQLLSAAVNREVNRLNRLHGNPQRADKPEAR